MKIYCLPTLLIINFHACAQIPEFFSGEITLN